jgi:hypothetical protein
MRSSVRCRVQIRMPPGRIPSPSIRPTTPKAEKTSWAALQTARARDVSAGEGAASMIRNATPWPAQAIASDNPAGPAPTIRTSAFFMPPITATNRSPRQTRNDRKSPGGGGFGPRGSGKTALPAVRRILVDDSALGRLVNRRNTSGKFGACPCGILRGGLPIKLFDVGFDGRADAGIVGAPAGALPGAFGR